MRLLTRDALNIFCVSLTVVLVVRAAIHSARGVEPWLSLENIVYAFISALIVAVVSEILSRRRPA